MRIIALGDTHGRTNWKKIVASETFDKVVFIGDYFDTHEDIFPEQQKQNFKEIVRYKKANKDKVVLLFGNHDYHYLRTTNEQYGGFQEWQKADISELLHSAIDEDLLQMCFEWQDLLFTHAGITKTWCKNNFIQRKFIEQSINDLFRFKPSSFKFTGGKNRDIFGDDVTQSPIWVRPSSLMKDKIRGYNQIVGHTTQERLSAADNLFFIDVLGTTGEYFVWEDNVFTIGVID